MSRVVNFIPLHPPPTSPSARNRRELLSWTVLSFRAKIRTRTNADFSTLIFPRALSRLSCLLIGVCAKMFARRVLIRLFGFVARRCLLVVKRTDYSLAINWDAFVVMQRWLKRARLLWFYGEANLRYFFFFSSYLFWKYV